jgi:hypothetical protein
MMEATGLQWRELIMAILPPGRHARIERVFQAGKPIVVFQKPPLVPSRLWGPNVITVDANELDKSLHDWQQSQLLFEKLIHRFTAPNDIVVDPFAGSGTTLRAAIGIGRRAWGCDNGSALHLSRLIGRSGV